MRKLRPIFFFDFFSLPWINLQGSEKKSKKKIGRNFPLAKGGAIYENFITVPGTWGQGPGTSRGVTAARTSGAVAPNRKAAEAVARILQFNRSFPKGRSVALPLGLK